MFIMDIIQIFQIIPEFVFFCTFSISSSFIGINIIMPTILIFLVNSSLNIFVCMLINAYKNTYGEKDK